MQNVHSVVVFTDDIPEGCVIGSTPRGMGAARALLAMRAEVMLAKEPALVAVPSVDAFRATPAARSMSLFLDAASGDDPPIARLEISVARVFGS